MNNVVQSKLADTFQIVKHQTKIRLSAGVDSVLLNEEVVSALEVPPETEIGLDWPRNYCTSSLG
jgi:hypothetical protein